jgi:hypothetical protein
VPQQQNQNQHRGNNLDVSSTCKLGQFQRESPS